MSINLTPHECLKDDESLRIEQVVKKDHEYHLIGQTKKVKGHTLFSFNTITKQIKVAPMVRKVYFGFNGNMIHKTEVMVEKDCIYLQALNEKNAKKKLLKMGYSITK